MFRERTPELPMTGAFLVGTWRGLPYTGHLDTIHFREDVAQYGNGRTVCENAFLDGRYGERVHRFNPDGTWELYVRGQAWRDSGRWWIDRAGNRLHRQILVVQDPQASAEWRVGQTILTTGEARSAGGIDYWTPTAGNLNNPRWWVRCPNGN